MVATSEAVMAGHTVFSERLSKQKSFKSGYRNRQKCDQNCMRQKTWTNGAENWQTHLEKSVLVNSWTSSKMAGEFKPQTRVDVLQT